MEFRTQTLDQLAEHHGTDKAMAGNRYTRDYETYMAPHRQDTVCLLELGIFKGGSIRMWRDYFPNGLIVGADQRPDYVEAFDEDDRVVAVQAKFDLDEALEAFVETLHGLNTKFDFIIDDADHRARVQKAVFKALWGLLKPGGVYFCEDTTANFHKLWRGSEGSRDTFWHFAQGLSDNIRLSNRNLAAHHEDVPWVKDIRFVHFYDHGGLIAIGKQGEAND